MTHMIATGVDVTDQREAELTVAHVLAAATDNAIIATGTDGVVTVFNAGAERMLGYDAEEVVGWVSPLLWHEPDELADRAASLDVAPGPALFRPAAEIGPQEWTYVRKDGSHVPVVLTTTEIRDDAGEVAGFLSVARDVNRERRSAEAMRAALARETAAADRLRELDRVRSDLVATVSHELRTPLTSILGNVELLADGDAGALSAPQARLVAAAERNARRLLSLIEDLLMLARIEAGAIKINARPVQVRAIVGGALEALHTSRASRGVELSVDLMNEHLVVLGDQAQLERVLINLVDNGLKFTPPGGHVRVTVDGEEDGYARLVVSDTGIGIPSEQVDSVFERFFRSPRSPERAAQGTGLGLAITRSIVERHGGRIWAASGGNRQGTEVTCLLPRAS
jgi:PAS domain S-box-containing protein